MRRCLGRVEERVGLVHLDYPARVHEDDAVRHLPGEPHLVGHAEHRHALVCEGDHRVEHLFDHLRVERGRRLVEQHDLRVHAERSCNRHALLLAADSWPGYLFACSGILTRRR